MYVTLFLWGKYSVWFIIITVQLIQPSDLWKQKHYWLFFTLLYPLVYNCYRKSSKLFFHMNHIGLSLNESLINSCWKTKFRNRNSKSLSFTVPVRSQLMHHHESYRYWGSGEFIHKFYCYLVSFYALFSDDDHKIKK